MGFRRGLIGLAGVLQGWVHDLLSRYGMDGVIWSSFDVLIS